MKANQPPRQAVNGAKLAKLNSPLFLWPATAALAVLLYFALSYLNDFLTHESTDDAFIEGHVVSIAPRISGQVLAVHVLDNQLVRSNDLLVEIDPADYAMTAAQKQSAADAQESSYKLALAGLRVDARKSDDRRSRRASNPRPTPPPRQATAARAKADFERSQELRKQKTRFRSRNLTARRPRLNKRRRT